MIIKFDNRDLTADMDITRVVQSVARGDTSITVENAQGFSADDYVLLESFGMGVAEVVKIALVPSNTSVTLSAGTGFAHTVDTIVTKILYNTIEFSRGATATLPTEILETSTIRCDNFFTNYEDTINTTGYGFSRGLNGVTGDWGNYSASQPYGGYAYSTVYAMRDSAYSLLTDKDRRFVTKADILEWINDAYSIAFDIIAQTNREYFLTVGQISVVAGTSLYDLPDDFYDLQKVYGAQDERPYDEINPNTDVCDNTFAIYGGKQIQLFNTPVNDFTLYIDYVAKAPRTTADDYEFDLPKVDLSFLKFYAIMMGKMKSENFSAAGVYKGMWQEGLSRLQVFGHRRTASSRSFKINSEQNV